MNNLEFLYKLASRTASTEELKAWEAYLQTLSKKEYIQLLEVYGKIVSEVGYAGTPDEELFAAIRAEIEVRNRETEGIDAGAAARSRSGHSGGGAAFRRNLLAAAAVLMMALAGIYFFNIPAKTRSPLKPPAAALASKTDPGNPGTNKAVLTLASGRQLILDDTSTGNIAMDAGVKIIKLDKGLVTYKDNTNKSREIAYNTITTPRGGQYQLILPDGSHAWLNAASSLRFPTAFQGSDRKVELTGEGYFEVTHDPAHPFIVSFNHTEVKVLGTAFNIMAYEDEAAPQTTLVNGSVQVSKGGRQVLLQPGKMAVVKEDRVDIQEADIEQVTAWKNGMLSLENADLATVLRQVSRWYNVNVHYQAGVPEKRFFGLISRSVSLTTILEYLRKNDVHIEQEGSEITVMP